jgi:glucose-6-phosphate-specific signal transduction histidine kinase
MLSPRRRSQTCFELFCYRSSVLTGALPTDRIKVFCRGCSFSYVTLVSLCRCLLTPQLYNIVTTFVYNRRWKFESSLDLRPPIPGLEGNVHVWSRLLLYPVHIRFSIHSDLGRVQRTFLKYISSYQFIRARYKTEACICIRNYTAQPVSACLRSL